MVECLPTQIPNSIEVDVTALNLNDSIHLRDLVHDATWTPVTDPDTMLLHVVALKEVEETAAAPAAAGAAASAEPEVVKKGKTDKADEKADKGEKKK